MALGQALPETKIGDTFVLTMPTYKLTLEYDGAAYAGWQRQPGQPTIQESLESALFHLTQESITTIAAGRTDSGVHALGQVVSFRSQRPFTPNDWTRGLNAILPKDIGIRATEPMPANFHAQHDAVAKVYEYRIENDRRRPVLDRSRVWHVPKTLDVEAMREAGAYIIGTHNCLAFQCTPTDNKNPICHIRDLGIVQLQSRIHIRIEADRFLKQMVRTIVGTLTEIGLHQRQAIDLKEIMASEDRRRAGKTAPAHGLFLVRVCYPRQEWPYGQAKAQSTESPAERPQSPEPLA